MGVHDESVGKAPETFHETESVDGSQLMPLLYPVREFSAKSPWLSVGLDAVQVWVCQSYFLAVVPLKNHDSEYVLKVAMNSAFSKN